MVVLWAAYAQTSVKLSLSTSHLLRAIAMRSWTSRMSGASVGARSIPGALTQATDTRGTGAEVVDMELEVVVVPVAGVERAKKFYQALGWREDADYAVGADFRVVQLVPPGLACSIIFGTGVTSAAPGSAQGLYLVVADIDAARAEFIDRGADGGRYSLTLAGCSTMPRPWNGCRARLQITKATARVSRSVTRTAMAG
jgi:catechol 2,3-dioxygenase-like lactoylglutathione lyase family enzyme